jgi:hypothetical protein
MKRTPSPLYALDGPTTADGSQHAAEQTQEFRRGCESAAVARLFEIDLLQRKNRFCRYYRRATEDFRVDRLLADMPGWSSAERVIANLALELWGYSDDDSRLRFDVRRCADQLEDSALIACLEAIAIRACVMRYGDMFRVSSR